MEVQGLPCKVDSLLVVRRFYKYVVMELEGS
jgi:hypothetical protein